MTFLSADAPECASDDGSLCDIVYSVTNVNWLADSADVFVAKPAKILLILVVAFLVRLIAHRLIKQLTRVNGAGRTGGLLRPLKERASTRTLLEGSTLLSERRAQRAATVGSILRSIASFVILGTAFVLILGELGINLAPIIASAGILGVALGFGAQNLVKDFLSGVFMILEDQYGVGDIIDCGEASGTVEEVGLRVTQLRDLNGTVWYVRNGEIIRVGNMSQGYAQAVLDIPVAHSTDLDHAAELIKEVAQAMWQEEAWADSILEEPELLGLEQLAPEAVVLRLVAKTKAGQQWAVKRELRIRIKKCLDEAGVGMPHLTALYASGITPDSTSPTTAKTEKGTKKQSSFLG